MKKKTALTKMHIAPSTVRYDAVAARDSNEVGLILAAVRKRNGYSLVTFSELLRHYGVDVSDKGISKWEKGYTTPSIYQLVAICHALNIKDNNTYESKKKLKGLIENNEFGRNLGQIKHIQSLYEGKKKVDNYSKYGFSQIIGRKTKGNIQGAIFSEFSSDKVEEEFERYVIKSHAECILEVYDGIDSDSQE